MYLVDSDVSRRANYLVNEIKLEWIKGRAVVRMQCYPRWWVRASRGGGNGRRREDNRGKGDGAGIRLANAFISIRRGRVTCSPLRSISSTSFAHSPPHPPSAALLPTSPPFPFAFCFHFFCHLLVISLSLFPSVFRSVSFSLRISSHPPFLSLCLFLSLSLFLSSLPLWTFSLCDFIFLPLISFCFHNDVRGARIFPRLCSVGLVSERTCFV